ncbi:MAG: glycosyltransferase [Deltaproteobacteria bacterium]|nr:glycosyltransferase [Deltaproteobacteria bacterium]
MKTGAVGVSGVRRTPAVLDALSAIDGADRFRWIKKSQYYYDDLRRLCEFHVEKDKAVLEIGLGSGFVLDACKPANGMGLDFSESVCREARRRYPNYRFDTWNGETELPESVRKAFPNGVDYIVLVNTVGYWQDIQKALDQLRSICNANTRIISVYYNFLWAPVLKTAEHLGLKMPQPALNWLSPRDVRNLLEISGYRVLKTGHRALIPANLGFFADFVNRVASPLPLIGEFGHTHYVIARLPQKIRREDVVASVVIPARNEAGNIEPAVRRMAAVAATRPEKYELIFVEGNSTDNTAAEIKRVLADPSIPKPFPVQFHTQPGKGKGDAVRVGFAKATGNLLMILDADLTVPPEDIPKFVDVYCEGRGEFINGCRLIYKMEKDAMRLLNLFGNKFFSMAFTWLLGQQFKDTLCGTKVLSRANYDRVAAGRTYFGDFDPFGDFDLLFGASKLDLEITEVPIRYRERSYGETNISRWKHGWLLLKMCVYATGKIKFVR